MELKFIDLILEKFYLSLPPKLQNPVFLWQNLTSFISPAFIILRKMYPCSNFSNISRLSKCVFYFSDLSVFWGTNTVKRAEFGTISNSTRAPRMYIHDRTSIFLVN